ncbi:MAG: type IV secretion system DNA-binding domain-containing protein [Armatimonadetes bacterium]|nr:type IV secretion system DNA-binding domain-containing protein [Armatimonadota bacterium]
MRKRQLKQPKHWIGAVKGWELVPEPVPNALVSLPPKDLARHCLIVGATGAGKSVTITNLIAQDILLRHSFAVLDLRGDIVATALELCAGHVEPERVVLFDLRERERPFGFNPLFGSGEPYFRALNVLNVVEKESSSWGVQLGETLRFAILLLAEVQMPLTCLERIFFDDAFRASLIAVSNAEDVKGFWHRYGDLSKERRQNLASPVLNKVSLLFATEGLRRTLGHLAPVDLGRHLNSPFSVTLMSLAADELHEAGRAVGSLMLAAFTREIFARITVPEEQRVKIRLYVDEFENFGTREFETIIAEARKFRLALLIAHQTTMQLSPKVRSIILNNIGAKLFFRTGREDSSILSRDLTGDPKAIDFSSFDMGEFMLWRNGQGLVHVEGNQPLVAGSTLSQNGEAYRQAVRALAPPYEPVATGTDSPSPPPRRSRKASSESILEDWL